VTERRGAELAASVAQLERECRAAHEATRAENVRQHAAHTTQKQSTEEAVQQAKKKTKDAHEAARNAEKSRHEWQEHAAALKQQLDELRRSEAESEAKQQHTLSTCESALARAQDELAKTRAEHAGVIIFFLAPFLLVKQVNRGSKASKLTSEKHVADAADKSKLVLRLVLKLKASCTSRVRPHTLLVAEGRIRAADVADKRKLFAAREHKLLHSMSQQQARCTRLQDSLFTADYRRE